MRRKSRRRRRMVLGMSWYIAVEVGRLRIPPHLDGFHSETIWYRLFPLFRSRSQSYSYPSWTVRRSYTMSCGCRKGPSYCYWIRWRKWQRNHFRIIPFPTVFLVSAKFSSRNMMPQRLVAFTGLGWRQSNSQQLGLSTISKGQNDDRRSKESHYNGSY